MKISFVDFWGGFLDNNNFFYHLMREIVEDVHLSTPENCDILFCGCYSNTHVNFYDKKKIHYSSEAWATANMDVFNFSISGEKFSETNVRIPHWMIYIDWFNVKTNLNPQYLIPLDYFFKKNEFSSVPKIKFASWVFNNRVTDRLNTIKNIERYKRIDLFGGAGTPIHHSEYEKLKVISNYKFNFCFENTIKEGYYTEKLIQAKVAGCIPIYKSHELFTDDFNEMSCLNVVNMSDEEIYEKIVSLDSDHKTFSKMNSEPLFINNPNLDTIKNDIYRKIIN